MSTRKVETQLLISPHIKVRAYRLAVLRNESVAEVWRAAIERGLPALEYDMRAELEELAAQFEESSWLLNGQSEIEWLADTLKARRGLR